MAPILYLSFRQVFLLYLVFFLFTFVILSASSDGSQLQSQQFLGRRRLLEEERDQDQLIPKKKGTNSSSSKNQTKLIKPNLSSKNQTKLFKTSLSSKNQTKITKASNSTKLALSTSSKSELKKLNSTPQLKKLNSTSQLKKLNFTSNVSASTKKTSDLLKVSSPKNKTSTKGSKTLVSDSESMKQTKNQLKTTEKKPSNQKKTTQEKKQPSWLDLEVDDDLVAEFRDLPTRFQQSLLPDIEKISMTSKKYLTKANKEMAKGFKPIVGNRYASIVASVVSFAFILIPLLLVSLIFNRIKAYFSIQKIVIFIQVYLSIYFSILCLSSIVTGLEPLRFFYATSQSTYVCLMVLQTLGYILYLLLLLMYLILVFSTESGLGSKLLGLGQIFVGFAVGLHFYVAVFHRVVLHQPPKATWKVHGIYAACFLVICLLAKFDRRKKAYVEDGGEEGKKN
ncbi:uncharacterized protein LOC110628765 [Manihot esculenta]|uniref:Uncharacterized protein n=1 Tax=Manihot esculenta TaxID=3983 RepID=A0A2C9UWE9_MANES|nr:uncharacterized protein LOC110628765 [Manihot esculenta]OAY35853.1 hypothetical protein MANES_12G135900v8 [Manihot esculenta]